MACLSPSPSGRRLSELLEEQQEPFSLDVHLLEKGCSSRLLDGYDTALCWPAAGNDGAAAVLRRLTSKRSKAAKKKPQPQQAGGLLRLLLSKILRRRAPAPRKPAALGFSDSFKTAATKSNLAAVAPAAEPSLCPDHLGAVKTGAGGAKGLDGSAAECCCYSDGEYSDDEKQQLSPVSVLEPHPFESSTAAHHHGGGKLSPSKNALDVFRELLDAACSPALLTQLLAKTDDLLLNGAAAETDDEEEDDDCYYRGSSPRSRRDGEPAAAYWDAHRAELARVSELVASEVPASKVTPADVRPEREDVGAEVAAAVLDALVRELVADLGSGGRC